MLHQLIFLGIGGIVWWIIYQNNQAKKDHIEKKHEKIEGIEAEEITKPKKRKDLKKLIITWALGIMLFMTFFPPWRWNTRKEGYHFVLSDVRSVTHNSRVCNIDIKQLFMQYLVVAIGTAFLILIIDKKEKKTNKKETDIS